MKKAELFILILKDKILPLKKNILLQLFNFLLIKFQIYKLNLNIINILNKEQQEEMLLLHQYLKL